MRTYIHKRIHVPVPRLTNADYLKQRTFLVQAWSKFRGAFDVLTYNQQMEVHAFYAPSKDLTDEEALAHRYHATTEQPSLPNRVGRLFPRLLHQSEVMTKRTAYLAEHPKAPYAKGAKPTRSQGKVNIRISALARPEPDLHKLAKVLLDVARDMQAEQDRAGKGKKAA